MNYYNPLYKPGETDFYAAVRQWGTGTILHYLRYRSADDRAISLASLLPLITADPLDDRVFGHPIRIEELPADLSWEDDTHLAADGREIVCEASRP